MLSFRFLIDMVMLCWIFGALYRCQSYEANEAAAMVEYAINVSMDVDEESKGMLRGCVWVCIRVRRGFNFLNKTFLEEHYVY